MTLEGRPDHCADPLYSAQSKITLPVSRPLRLVPANAEDRLIEDNGSHTMLLERSALKVDAVPAHVPSYSLLVGGVQVTDQNKQDVLDDGKISYDLQNKTLSLQDTAVTAQAETGSGGGIFS